MAHLHFRRDVYKSGGQQAAGRIAYITREPARGAAEQQLRYISEDREDCLFTTTKHLPAWAKGNPYTYFAAAEKHEGVGWVAFEELKISLPVELTNRQNMHLAQDLVRAITRNVLPITYAFHAPLTLDRRQKQPHLHCILSRRGTDAIDRGPVHHFRKHNAKHPDRGGAHKDPAFAERTVQRHLRVLIADVTNLHLERAGCPGRVHPGTLKSQGIEREPEPKLLPSESREYREEGVIGPRMQEVLNVRATRRQTRAQEQASAVKYWTARKAELGLTDALDDAAQLAVLRLGSLDVRGQLATAAVTLGEAGIEADDRVLGDLAGETYAQLWQEAQALWEDVQVSTELGTAGRAAARQARQEAQDVWRETEDLETRAGVGQDAWARAQADAYATWEDDQVVQVLWGLGWQQTRQTWEEGYDELTDVLMEQERQHEVRRWTTTLQDLQAIAAQLDQMSDEGGQAGKLRIRLWERDQGQGL